MQKNMTEGNPLKIIIAFTLPLFIGNLFQQIYNTVDSMIVGRFVGENALAAVGSTGTLMFVVLGLANGMSSGFTVLTAQKYGEGSTEGTKASVANGILLSAVVSLIMTVLSVLLMKPILGTMNTPKEVYPYACDYISIIFGGIVCSVAYNFFAACLRAIGNSRIPLVALIFSACLNIVLDLFFIRVLSMGVAGAAWATVISQGMSALLCAGYIWKKEPLIRPSGRQFRFNGDFTKRQLAVGVPMALQFGITGSGTVVMQAAVNLFGATAVAAYSAAGKITSLLMQGAIAIGQTMATYAGQNFGAKKLDRIRKGVRCAVLTDLVYSLGAALISVGGLSLFMKLFFDDTADMGQVLFYARRYISICSCFYVPLSVIFTFRNTMQGCGYGFLPMMGGVVELAARWICAMVAMNTLNYTVACFCDPAAWLAAGLFTMASYFFVLGRMKKSLYNS